MGGGNRQIYVANVCSLPSYILTESVGVNYLPQLPYTAGWQDLKDLFRQAGMVDSIVLQDIGLAY